MGAFSEFRDKKPKKRKNETPSVEEYYISLARKTAVLRYACLILIVLLIVYSLSFRNDVITIDNFRYMLKFIDIKGDADAPKGTALSFDGSSGSKGLLYKGDLAVINDSGLTVVGWDGNILLRSSFSYDHPIIAENGINLFCCDMGSKEVRIYNSYSLISTVTFDYPVLDLAVSQSGGFAVVGSSKGYRSAVFIYDKEFRLVFTRNVGDKYVDFADISANGKSFITAAHYSSDGQLTTLVSRFDTDVSDEPLETKEFIGEMPLGIYYTEGGYALLTDSALRRFDNDGNEISAVSFSGKKLLSGSLYGERSLICYAKEGLSGGTVACVYNSDGSLAATREYPSALNAAVINGDRLYAVYPGRLCIADIAGGGNEVYSVPTSFCDIIPDGSNIILFSNNEADYFIPENFDKAEDTQ